MTSAPPAPGTLSALTVELRIALAGGANTTGSRRSMPERDFGGTGGGARPGPPPAPGHRGPAVT
ncbi:hypothetical protein ACIQZB_30515 [Streptomyces sp. NPDC097727]|uniref:hypothetical protein n=1 Tax=Streptomyces sp. NPDC097727 TaxID=3366092 RepID=UPI00380791B8